MIIHTQGQRTRNRIARQQPERSHAYPRRSSHHHRRFHCGIRFFASRCTGRSRPRGRGRGGFGPRPYARRSTRQSHTSRRPAPAHTRHRCSSQITPRALSHTSATISGTDMRRRMIRASASRARSNPVGSRFPDLLTFIHSVASTLALAESGCPAANSRLKTRTGRSLPHGAGRVTNSWCMPIPITQAGTWSTTSGWASTSTHNSSVRKARLRLLHGSNRSLLS
jgi:hypothetical protein